MLCRSLLIIALIMIVVGVRLEAAVIVNMKDYKGTPIEHGLRDLRPALEVMPDHISVYVGCAGSGSSKASEMAGKILPDKAESFAIMRDGNDIAIIGRDQTGAMYGCFELAERLRMRGREALDIREPIVQSPALAFRAVNPFFTLPYKESEEEWWFLQEDYWEGYLGQLARARFNWVDLHGAWNISDGHSKNLYPYLVASERFPEVGLEPEKARRNLRMLQKVIKMAKERGIRFGLMSYSVSWDGPGLRKSPYEANEENLTAYTREAVETILRACPDLAMIGFRIGESGMGPDFYRNSYIPAVKEAGGDIGVYTRSWRTTKDKVLELGTEFPGRYFVEIKFNGEQFGPSYIIAGGRAVDQHSYFFQDYYSYPRNYEIIYQIRVNGTHRVFPWGSPILAARANECGALGGALGVCIEQMDSYYPQYDFKHREDSPNRWYRWNYQRDWFWYQSWGRTAYNPSLAYKDDVWTDMFARRFGRQAGAELYEAMKWASKIVTDAYTAYSLGPDHRHHAPEMETGGSVKNWAVGAPFDLQNIRSPGDFARDLMAGRVSAKKSPFDMADLIKQEADMTRKHLNRAKMENPTPEFNDLVTELGMLCHLADYYSHKLRAATLYAIMHESGDTSFEADTSDELAQARQAWGELAELGDIHYQPMPERIRMGEQDFIWSSEESKLDVDPRAVDELVKSIKDSGKQGKAPSWERRGDRTGPIISEPKVNVTEINAISRKLQVNVSVDDPSGVENVVLRYKPLPSETEWSEILMKKQGLVYSAEVDVTPDGLVWCIAALDKDGNGSTWPDFRRETPYRVVMAWNSSER